MIGLDAATGELLEWCKRLSREKVSAESRNPEPETVAAERTFTEAEVRAAMRLLKSDVAIRHIFDKLRHRPGGQQVTEAQRNLLDAAKHLLDVIAEPNEIAYELTIDNATNRPTTQSRRSRRTTA